MRVRLLVLWLVLGLALPATSHGQAAMLRASDEIDLTEQRLERARAVVGPTGNAEALAEVEQAGRLQSGARMALERGRPRIALDLTLRARGAAERAVALTGTLPDPQRVRGQLERTRTLIEQARGRLEGCGREEPHALMTAADDMQRRAEDAARGGHYLASLQLTMGARQRVQRALRQCNVVEDARDGADRAVHRTDEVIRRAQGRVNADTPGGVREMLARATSDQESARQQLVAGNYESSLRLTLDARALAFRAARLAGRVR